MRASVRKKNSTLISNTMLTQKPLNHTLEKTVESKIINRGGCTKCGITNMKLLHNKATCGELNNRHNIYLAKVFLGKCVIETVQYKMKQRVFDSTCDINRYFVYALRE